MTSAPGRAARFWSRCSGLDVGLCGAGLAFGLVSLFYPFGRDQGLFFYTSREWLLRERMPYRDVFDHKPPFIYVIHALQMVLFGENTWGLRLGELLLFPLIGYLGARIATPRGSKPPAGMIGAACLTTSVFYYGVFNFWDTGQCEIWYATLALASLAIVMRAPTLGSRAAAGAGVLAGMSLFTKPTAISFVAVAAVALVLRLREARDARAFVRTAAAYAGGAAGFAAVMLGYFAAKGALAAMIDILVGANGWYLVHERSANSLGEVLGFSWRAFRWLDPFSGLFVVVTAVAFAVGAKRRDRRLVERYALPLVLVIASYAAVFQQMKFYAYHWDVLVAPCAVFAGTLYEGGARMAALAGRPVVLAVAWAAASIAVFVASGDQARWAFVNRQTFRWLTGAISREQFASSFDIPSREFNVPTLDFHYGEAERVGLWLRDHVRPGDTVAVRGFEPQIYEICRCRYSGRFYWTAFLTDSRRAYRREEWIEEDVRELDTHPPRYVVALTKSYGGLDAADWFEDRGYTRVLETSAYTVLDRVPPPGTCRPPADVPAEKVPAYRPVEQRLHACTGPQISTYASVCAGGDSPECKAWFADPVNAGCVACVNPLTETGTPTGTGALMYDVDGRPFPNLPGCLALADGNTSCAAPLEQFLSCAYHGCDACYGNQSSFTSCITRAQTLGCAERYRQLGPCQPDYAAGGAETRVCGNGDLSAITNVICGSGP